MRETWEKSLSSQAKEAKKSAQMSCPCIRMNNFPTPAFTPRLHEFAVSFFFFLSPSSSHVS
jgi:hypothetical protein